jgi:1-acyl-sn-glycerol-3-phosphate acyltransferase
VRYTLDWGQRQGYARLALRHKLPILLFVTEGADDLYQIYGDGYRLSKRLTGTDLLPLCLPLGSHGLPFGPSRPVKLTTRISGPILPDPSAPDPVAALDAAVRAGVEAMLKPLRERAAPGPRGDPWS